MTTTPPPSRPPVTHLPGSPGPAKPADRSPYVIPRRMLDAAAVDAGGPAEAGWIDYHGVIHVTTSNVIAAMTFTASLAARLVAAAAARGAADADIARAGTVALVKSSFNTLDAQVSERGGTESSVVVMSMRNCIPGDDQDPAVAATPRQADAEVAAALNAAGIRCMTEQWTSTAGTADHGVTTFIKLAAPPDRDIADSANRVTAEMSRLPGVIAVNRFGPGLRVIRKHPQ